MRPGRDANEVVEGKEMTFVADEEGREDAGTNDETSAGRESSVKKAHRDNIVGSDMFLLCGFLRFEASRRTVGFEASRLCGGTAVLRYCGRGGCLLPW